MRYRIFFLSFSIVFLIIASVRLVQNTGPLHKAYSVFFPSPTPEILQIKGIGVIGDSLSDEYQADDTRGYEYAPTTLNWIEQLVKSRGINFGLWNTWGDIRRTGFEYNWSRTGATTTAAILNGQHTGLAKQAAEGNVNIVIICIGENDYFPFNETYSAIYNGILIDKSLADTINNTTDNIETIINTIRQAKKANIILVTIPDSNINTAVQLVHQDAAGRQRVSNVINSVNQKIVDLARKYGLSVADANLFYRNLLNSAPLGSIRVGTEDISLYIPGDEPHHAFLSDAVHPGAVLNGLFANYIISRMNEDFHTAIRPLSDEEILKNAGM